MQQMQPTKASIYKRNYALMVLEGSLFMGGIGFFNINTVIPMFINTVTHSKQLVGLTITFGSFCTYLTRLALGPIMPKIRNNALFTTIAMCVGRPQMLLAAIFLFSGHYKLAVAVLIASYAFLWMSDGVIVLPWSEVLANTVDEERHGRLLGSQMLYGGFAAVGAGILISHFLNDPRLDIRGLYGWIFLLGGVLLILSCFAMAGVEPYPQKKNDAKVDFRKFYRNLPRYLLWEKDNTRQLLAQFVLLAASMGLAFIILFAQEKIRVGTGQTATLILVQSIGNPFGGWLWGQLCDRLGSEKGMRVAAVNILLISALPLLALPAGQYAMAVLVPAMFLAGLNNGFTNCSYIYTVQAVRPESRPACLVLSSLIALPATFSNYFAGFVSDRYGYVPLFVICIGISLLGFWMTMRIRPVRTVVRERQARDRQAGAEKCAADTRV